MVGTVSLMQTLEFIYYLKKYNYEGAIYFDTFPIREEPLAEIRQNVKSINKINSLIDNLGMNNIQEIISRNDAIAANELFLDCLK
jgi:xylose isomerase